MTTLPRMLPRRVVAPGVASALAAASAAASLLAVVLVNAADAWGTPGASDLPVDLVIGLASPGVRSSYWRGPGRREAWPGCCSSRALRPRRRL